MLNTVRRYETHNCFVSVVASSVGVEIGFVVEAGVLVEVTIGLVVELAAAIYSGEPGLKLSPPGP